VFEAPGFGAKDQRTNDNQLSGASTKFRSFFLMNESVTFDLFRFVNSEIISRAKVERTWWMQH